MAAYRTARSADAPWPHIRSLPAAVPISIPGDRSDDRYLLLEGSASLLGADSVVLKTIVQGEMVQRGQPDLALVTREPSRVLVLPRDEMIKEVDGEVVFAASMVERLVGAIQDRTHEIAELQKQVTAVNELLGTLSRAPSDVNRILNEVVRYAALLCDVTDAGIMQVDGDELRMVARYGPTPILPIGSSLKKSRGLASWRSVIDCTPVHVADILAAEHEFSEGAIISRRNGIRTVFAHQRSVGDRDHFYLAA